MQIHWRAAGRRWLISILGGGAVLALHGGVAHSQELLLLGGWQHTPSLNKSSYGYAGSYQHNVAENWYASFDYLNEGHVPNHHRDGYGGQLWWRYLAFEHKLALALGAGPYAYYDTTDRQPNGAYIDSHGGGLLASAAATWYIDGGPWMLQARFNRTQTPSSIKVNSLLLGVGYQLERGGRGGPLVPAPGRSNALTGNELTLSAGTSIVNSTVSQRSTAATLEYRHGLGRYVDGTLSYLDEGGGTAIHRRGVAAQLWLGQGFFADKFTIGAGAGPYYATKVGSAPDAIYTAPRKWGTLVTMSASYRLNARWVARLSWLRTGTSYDYDTDVFQAGIGYRF